MKPLEQLVIKRDACINQIAQFFRLALISIILYVFLFNTQYHLYCAASIIASMVVAFKEFINGVRIQSVIKEINDEQNPDS